MSTIKKTEYALLQFLSLSLQPSGTTASLPVLTGAEWAQVLSLADRHEILPLLEDVMKAAKLPPAQQGVIQVKSAKTIQKSIQLQVLNAKLTVLLQKAGITAVTLKGCAMARLYPIPELRKTSDIDLFVSSKPHWESAVQILCANGFRVSGAWHANHHAVLVSDRNEVVELHAAWTESFKEKHLNQYLERLLKESDQHCRLVDCQGFEVYAYDIPWQAFYLLLHMLLHFVGSGFGLRNLCDWVVLWENCDDDQAREAFWNQACESGTSEFAKAVTALCITYLGLPQEKSPIPVEAAPDQEVIDSLVRDILDAGEFGYGEAERMVGIDGNTFRAYWKEFHHQMHLNFPQAGRTPVCWPPLWCATLVRFLWNNKRLNRPSVRKIIQKAGQRGQLVRRLTSSGKKKRQPDHFSNCPNK